MLIVSNRPQQGTTRTRHGCKHILFDAWRAINDTWIFALGSLHIDVGRRVIHFSPPCCSWHVHSDSVRTRLHWHLGLRYVYDVFWRILDHGNCLNLCVDLTRGMLGAQQCIRVYAVQVKRLTRITYWRAVVKAPHAFMHACMKERCVVLRKLARDILAQNACLSCLQLYTSCFKSYLDNCCKAFATL